VNGFDQGEEDIGLFSFLGVQIFWEFGLFGGIL